MAELWNYNSYISTCYLRNEFGLKDKCHRSAKEALDLVFPRRCVSQLGWSTICHTLPHGITLGGEQPRGEQHVTCHRLFPSSAIFCQDLENNTPVLQIFCHKILCNLNIQKVSWDPPSLSKKGLSHCCLFTPSQLGPPISSKKVSVPFFFPALPRLPPPSPRLNYPRRSPSAFKVSLRMPQSVPAWTVSWPQDPIRYALPAMAGFGLASTNVCISAVTFESILPNIWLNICIYPSKMNIQKFSAFDQH